MRRICQLALGMLSVAVLAALIAETTLGQSPNEICPYLQTDNIGAPLNPPYSQYPTDAGGTAIVFGERFDQFSPCCGTTETTTDSNTGVTVITAVLSGNPAQYNPATDSSFCQPPDGDLGNGPMPDPFGLVVTINQFFGNFCPQMVQYQVTMEGTNGAVKNCIPPPPTDLPPGPSGGSNFSNATGGNAG